MANIPKVDGNFELEVNNATQSYEDTLYTDNKNISGNIHIHITAKSGILNNTPTSGITYTEDTSQQSVLPSEGALYLNEGYYQNTKITLDHMLPDPSGTYTNPGTNDIRAGRKAYDGSGKLIVGTMADITPGFSGGTPSLTNITNTITTNMATASSGTYKINAVAKAKATRTKVSYNNDYTGYLDKASGTEASAATTSAEGSINAVTIYIKDASPSAEVSSLSVPSVEVSGVVTNMATTSSGNFYIQINATKTDGSVKAKYKNTQEGYAPANAGSESGASTITPNITGSGTKIYIKAGAITNNTSGGTSSGTINRGNQIKIDSGYYGSTLYYQAQANTGTTIVSSVGNTNCDGYTIVKVPNGSASQPTATVTAGTVSLSGVIITLQATVTPSVSSGWVEGGTAGVVKIKGDVPVESKSCTPSNETQTITPSSGKLLSSVVVNAMEIYDSTHTPTTNTIYFVKGRCSIKYGSGEIVLENQYFKFTAISSSSFTYQIIPEYYSSSSETTFPNWEATTISATESPTIKYFTGNLYKCSSSAASITQSISATSTGYKVNRYNIGCILYVYCATGAASSSPSYSNKKTTIINKPFIDITYIQSNSSSTSYSKSIYRYVDGRHSNDGITYDSFQNRATSSTSGTGSVIGTMSIYLYYFEPTQVL